MADARGRILFVASHLGYPLDRIPLGGGAMVGARLARLWSAREDFRLTVLGAGPRPPHPGVDYAGALSDAPADPTRLSEFGYARFCRDFERASAAFIAARPEAFPPRDTVVVLNDISESPDARRLRRLGYRVASIWHVDVVDFFNRMYLRGLFPPELLARTFDGIEKAGLGWAAPDLLKLVFEKQRRIVEHSSLLAMPSKRMAETALRCYGRLEEKGAAGSPPLGERIRVIPWGGWDEALDEDGVAVEARRLGVLYGMRPGAKVLMTLSRISPEKGIHVLLRALKIVESTAPRLAEGVHLLVCGEPAFMRGRSYDRKLRRAAARLRRARVHFTGHLPPAAKQAHFRLADVFVSPSIHESYGLGIAEALRAGLPVLASDHSGAEEMLAPGFSRVVHCDGRTGERFAAEIEAMLKDPASLRSMGARAKEAAKGMSFEEAARNLADAALGLVPQGAA